MINKEKLPIKRIAELAQPKFSVVTVNFKLSGNRHPESEKKIESVLTAICLSILYSGLLRSIQKPRILYYAAGSCPETQAIN